MHFFNIYWKYFGVGLNWADGESIKHNVIDIKRILTLQKYVKNEFSNIPSNWYFKYYKNLFSCRRLASS